MFSSQAHPPPPARRRIGPPGIAILASALVGASLAGCSGDAVRSLALEAGYGPKTVTAPDFVTASRAREAPDFMDVGVDAPRRPARAKSAEGQKAMQAELEGARDRNAARGRAAESAGKGTAQAVKPAPPPPEGQ